jgi:D-serine deaminase-like pyridoxal phosphate-dependent protein
MHRLTDPSDLLTPALLFLPGVIQANIARVVELAGGPARLRPHVKTHKTAEVVKLQLAAGVTKHKCATVAEAEVLAAAGAPDVLLAYPVVGPTGKRLAALARQFPDTQFSALVDSDAGLDGLAAAAELAGRPLGFLVDLNVGQDRTGIRPGEAAMQLYRRAAMLGLTPEGLHAYDGHHRHPDPAERSAAVRAGFARVVEMREALERWYGMAVPRIVAGGTPTFPVYAAMRDVPGLECSPGTYVLHDHGYGTGVPDLTGLRPAAVLATRVVSKPTPTRVTFDLGTKAVASDPPLARRVHLLDAPPHELVAHNEEHLVIETPEPDRYAIGDVVYAVPGHVCPSVALHRTAVLVESGKVAGEWTVTARDRVLTV